MPEHAQRYLGARGDQQLASSETHARAPAGYVLASLYFVLMAYVFAFWFPPPGYDGGMPTKAQNANLHAPTRACALPLPRNKMSSQKNASNTCDVQGRTVDRVANETAAGGSMEDTSKNTIVASDVERSPANVKVPDINYGYNPSELLHDRLGHIGRTRLEATKNRSTGLEKLFKNYKPIHFCTACCKAKMTKGSHSPWSRFYPADYVWQSISMELVGPFKEKTIGGARFILTIVDRYSGWVCTYPMKQKSQVLEMFKQFLADEGLAQWGTVAVVECMTDWGTEFENPFKAFAYEKGIKIRKSCPYTAWENGLAEQRTKKRSTWQSVCYVEHVLMLSFGAMPSPPLVISSVELVLGLILMLYLPTR